jgi:hypothetical protein
MRVAADGETRGGDLVPRRSCVAVHRSPPVAVRRGLPDATSGCCGQACARHDRYQRHTSRSTRLKRRVCINTLAGVTLALSASAVGHPVAVTPAQAATCSQYSNQAAAQRAHDTRDADGNGVYSESLPCPCGEEAAAKRPRRQPRRVMRPRPAAPGRAVSSRSDSAARSIRTSGRTCCAQSDAAGRESSSSIAPARTPAATVCSRPPGALGDGPRRVSARGGSWSRRAPGPWVKPSRLAGGRGLRPERREPVARFDDGDQAAALLRRHALQVRLLLTLGARRAPVARRAEKGIARRRP